MHSGTRAREEMAEDSSELMDWINATHIIQMQVQSTVRAAFILAS